MTTAKVLLKLLLKVGFTVLLCWLAFAFVFHFGNVQALGLGLAFALAIDLATARKAPEQASFTRHCLRLEFHLFRMLTDLRLIHGDEEWKTLIGGAPTPGLWERNSIYYSSISAYVLATSPGLVHFTNFNLYKEQWMVDVKLEGIEMSSQSIAWSPDVFVKPGKGGHHFGIRVNKNWWKTAKEQVLPGIVLAEDIEYEFGTVRLSLAVLPYEITHTYYRETTRDHQVSVNEVVVESGWENQQLGGAEIGYFGEGYEHKYATVWAQHFAD